jgi:hypothetical protein
VAVVISLRPTDKRGGEILDDLGKQTSAVPEVSPDGTRQYHLDAPEATSFDSFDHMLDRIDPRWRDHVTTWRET